MLTHAANVIVRTLLSPICAACRERLDRPLDGPICGACWLAIPRLTPPLCDWCGDALPTRPHLVPLCARCLRSPPSFELARSAGRYDGSLRDLIHAFKYEGRRILGPPLARLMRDAGAGMFEGATAVVPVPLHPWRQLRRGFNQADDLAQHLGVPVWRVLRRSRLGQTQARLGADTRGANARGAYSAWTWPSLVPGDRFSRRLVGATVVLVDDVMTTGATMDACSQVLLGAGAKTVRALTVARTMTRKGQDAGPL